jgi:hypothetical protein
LYEHHPDISTPPHDHVIRRYQDLSKFVDLLNRKSLYFSRVDRMDDPYEGLLTNVPYTLTIEQAGGSESAYKAILKFLNEDQRTIARRLRLSFYVNCWNDSEAESSAMWGLYLKNKDEGVAVQSTVGRLTRCLTEAAPAVYVGQVSYLDYQRQVLPRGNVIWHVLHKRHHFQHESEVRAIVDPKNWTRD